MRTIQARVIVFGVLKLAAFAALGGCATGLTVTQGAELKAYEARGLKVEEKNEVAGAFLGILPGGGSFYTGHIGLGILNFLMWPSSIFWDPVSGTRGAESANYAATRAHVAQLENAELDSLDERLHNKAIDETEYSRAKEAITRKYRVP